MAPRPGLVARLACIDLPALPLQLAARTHPEWRGHAVVVVDKDSPRGVVLWANERARRSGILPGLRYAGGLSLDAELRATVVAPAEIERARTEIATLLRRYSPSVEPNPVAEEPGVFWLDASGMSLLYSSLEAWASALRATLTEAQLTCGVAVGYSRFASYASARALAGRGQVVWTSPEEEQLACARVPLHRVGLEPKAREALAQLGVHSVGQLARLPEAGLARRFGRAVQRLHQLATGARDEPLTPTAAEEPLQLHVDFDEPVADRDALLFFVKQLLDPLLARLASRGQALRELRLTLDIDTGVTGTQGTSAPTVEILRPSVPSLDARMLLGLVQLRLEVASASAGGLGSASAPARGLGLLVLGEPASREQLALFLDEQQPRRDLALGAHALARLRASLGDAAVVRAQLRPGHLPEASYAWEPVDTLVHARPRRVLERPLVRRVRTRPEPLPARPPREPDGWLLLGIAGGPVTRLDGPFCVSGGWWRSGPSQDGAGSGVGDGIRREYYFAELKRGELCWIYYDRRRRRWYRHGDVA